MAAVGIPSRDPATGLTADAFLATAAIDPQGYRRSSSKTGYLDPVSERTNLVVLTSVTATRILFADKVATGVRYAAAAGAPSYAVNARKEVVLCAGTVGSPRALLSFLSTGLPDKAGRPSPRLRRWASCRSPVCAS